MDIVIQKLIDFWLYDIKVFSNPWIYYPLLIPAACYLSFFLVKWSVITAPLWLPITIIFNSFYRYNNSEKIGELEKKLNDMQTILNTK